MQELRQGGSRLEGSRRKTVQPRPQIARATSRSAMPQPLSDGFDTSDGSEGEEEASEASEGSEASEISEVESSAMPCRGGCDCYGSKVHEGFCTVCYEIEVNMDELEEGKCRGGCGFYGAESMGMYCSVCSTKRQAAAEQIRKIEIRRVKNARKALSKATNAGGTPKTRVSRTVPQSPKSYSRVTPQSLPQSYLIP